MSDVSNFPKKFISEFIELYKSLPCLWKLKSREYYDRDKKKLAYRKMAKKLKEIDPLADRRAVTKKINSLRCSYRKEKKKIRLSLNAGTGEMDVHIPRLWYYHQLQFLEDQEEPDMLSYQQSFLEGDDSFLYLEDSQASETSHGSLSDSGSSSPPKKKNKKNNNIPTSAVAQLLCDARCEDDHDIFGRNVANKLRSLPNTQRIYLEKVINDAIFEAQLGNLSKNCFLQTSNKSPR